MLSSTVRCSTRAGHGGWCHGPTVAEQRWSTGPELISPSIHARVQRLFLPGEPNGLMPVAGQEGDAFTFVVEAVTSPHSR
jgi:hypothetical protein